MNRTRLGWYVGAALLALAPVGYRLLNPKSPTPRPVDPAMARAGQELFHHEWKPGDPLANGGDGLGPVFNAASCVACHSQGGPGGGGGLESNVTSFIATNGTTTRQGVVHSQAVKYRETLRHVHPQLPAVSRPALAMLVALPGRLGEAIPPPPGVSLSQRNTPALFGAKLIDDLPDHVIIAEEKRQRLRAGLASHESEELPVGRALRLAGGRVGKFGWKGQTATLGEFVQAACANELGLGNPGSPQPAPLGRPDYRAPALDLTLEQCDQLTAFVASLPRPVERQPVEPKARENAEAGKYLFSEIGCADCHTPDLGPAEGIYSDLLLHRMGQDLVGGGYYNQPTPAQEIVLVEGPAPREWRTPPLWGVADSAPYLHDGRAATLEEAIQLHGGQGARSAGRFAQLSPAERGRLIAFLKTLRAPLEDDKVTR